ncbi:hypothetical protein JR316_0002206 [Psilocybe cubensis]|uniref:Uncharacterized protein n=1 Tax=Psilocybe cubensis TaxID=181762 RepID=A0ACB8HBC7_PSICU|nr:hypothetical protein JR316_0002206 [Psilocybe cubensis]KAH9485298.1 hypothetical protein JR316_0002206 [Psilocybe cubensis]
MTINSIQALSEDIARLRELKERVQHVRQLPPMLVKSTAKGTTADAFARMRALSEHLASEATQRALVRARDSLAEDPSDVRGEGRPQRRTRTHGRSPEGYVADEEERGAPLPHSTEPGVTVSELGEWARAYNSTHTNKIRIRGRTLRMAIPDVMTVYMGIGTQERVVVETIRAFGSREMRWTGPVAVRGVSGAVAAAKQDAGRRAAAADGRRGGGGVRECIRQPVHVLRAGRGNGGRSARGGAAVDGAELAGRAY